MLNKLMVTIIFFLVVLVNTEYLSADAYQRKIVVGMEILPPFQYLDEEGKPAGLDVNLMNLIAEKAGYEVKYVVFPWERILQMLATGRIDIALSAVLVEERKQFSQYSEVPFRLGYNSMFILDSDKERFQSIETLEDLLEGSFRIGVTRGVMYSNEYRRYFKNDEFKQKLVIVSENTQLIKMLNRKRVDVIFEGQFSMIYKLKSMLEGKGIVLHQHLHGEDEAASYLLFGTTSLDKQTIQALNEAMKEIYNGTAYASVLREYGSIN